MMRTAGSVFLICAIAACGTAQASGFVGKWEQDGSRALLAILDDGTFVRTQGPILGTWKRNGSEIVLQMYGHTTTPAKLDGDALVLEFQPPQRFHRVEPTRDDATRRLAEGGGCMMSQGTNIALCQCIATLLTSQLKGNELQLEYAINDGALTSYAAQQEAAKLQVDWQQFQGNVDQVRAQIKSKCHP